MEQKPFYYDGSFHSEHLEEAEASETFELTEEMRNNIGKNPYSLDMNA